MRLLVFGITGQVGNALARSGGALIIPVGRADADLSDPGAIRRVIAATDADAVVNAAAYTAVDKAESEPALAQAVNAVAPGAMAEACAARTLPFVHLSTDYVFDGTKAGPYLEDDPVAPVSVYGATKEAGERAVRAAGGRSVVLRTSWVFSDHGANFVKTMLRLADSRPELRVVDDQTGGPTAAADIAAAVGRIAAALRDGAPGGIYNFSGVPATTWHGFATAIFATRRALTGAAAPVIHPITTAEFPTPARRPRNSVLDGAKLRRDYGIDQPDWRPALAAVLGTLLQTTGPT